jgi:hypothetical protein
MTRFKRVLLMTSLPVLAVVLALTVLLLRPSHTSASAATLVPYQASVSETFSAAMCGQWAVCITATGTGQATHLGAISEDASIVVDINPADQQNGCNLETRTTTLTAANGDTITMSGSGLTGCPESTNEANDRYVVTGGTGRFQGASGSGTDSNTHTFTGPDAGVATTTFSGDLSSVGSLTS